MLSSFTSSSFLEPPFPCFLLSLLWMLSFHFIHALFIYLFLSIFTDIRFSLIRSFCLSVFIHPPSPCHPHVQWHPVCFPSPKFINCSITLHHFPSTVILPQESNNLCSRKTKVHINEQHNHICALCSVHSIVFMSTAVIQAALHGAVMLAGSYTQRHTSLYTVQKFGCCGNTTQCH